MTNTNGKSGTMNGETPEDLMPDELSHAGAVVDQAIDYLMKQEVDPLAIASALLGGSLGLMAKTMDDAAITRVLHNAIESVESGELRDEDQLVPPAS